MPDAPRPKEPPAPYEFSDVHKDSIGALAQSMSFVGVCVLLFGALVGLFALVAFYEGFVPNGLGALAFAAIEALVAWWLMSAGRSLSAMVRTRGRDVQHLMEAVRQLRRLFALALPIVLLSMMAVVGLVVWSQFAATGKCFGLFG
jgi:hypothetical protein